MRRLWYSLLFVSMIGLITAQEKPNSEWIIIDPDFNSEVIGEYIQICIENEFFEFGVQKNNKLKVEARVGGQKGIRLLDLKFRTQQGSYAPLDMEMYNKLKDADSTIEARILGKKYKWDDIQPPPKFDPFGGPVTVFEERDSKQCRDSFWWSRNAFEMSTYLRWVYRPPNKSYAVLIEPGFNEAGYPSAMSKNLKFGVASDITYAFISLPAPSGLVIYNKRPLDGAFGGGFRFDTHRFGGMIAFSDIDWLGDRKRTLEDQNNILYLKKYAQLYVSLTSQIPPIKKKIKMRPDDSQSEKIVWPTGSLRVRMGAGYNELVLRTRPNENTDTTKTEIEMYTAGLDAFRLFSRFEYVTDAQPDGSGAVSLAYQISLWNQFETYIRATYRIFPLMEVGLIVGATSNHTFYDRTNDLSNSENKTVLDGGFVITPILTMVF